ncbi:MAG: hypothetical protein P1P88_02500 [Bacteroidales bacterium]|nr:hypothetical protein [Bacteroidales bacterium]
MEKFKEFINEFYFRLEILLKEEGFKSNKSKNEISKGTKTDWSKITFDMNKMYDFTYNVNCAFKVRNNIIRTIYEKIIPEVGRKGDRWFCLLYRPYKLCECYYPKITDWETIRDTETKISGKVVDFSNASSVDKWFAGFEEFLNSAGFDFFDRFKEVDGYDKWLNKPLLENSKLTEIYVDWDSRPGLISAQLCENPNYEQVYEIWKQHFETVKNKKALQEIIDLKNFLDNYSPTELYQMVQT